jgi:hypothetical protein
MANRLLKNNRKKPSITSDNKCKIKKSKSTPKNQNKRTTPLFHIVEIRLSEEDYQRGLPYFENKKYLDNFIQKTYMEKVRHLESHNKFARQRRKKHIPHIRPASGSMPIIRQ